MTELNIKTIEEILKVDYCRSGPLAHVEDVALPEPLQFMSAQSVSRKHKLKRGPKPLEEWTDEVREAWSDIDEEDRLRESWFSSLPQVQRLAASKHGGRSIGKGLALQELLRKAIKEAQQYETDEKTHEILLSYPRMKMKKIAAKFGLSREHFSRRYVTKAARLLTKAFQHVLDRSAQDMPREHDSLSSPRVLRGSGKTPSASGKTQ